MSLAIETEAHRGLAMRLTLTGRLDSDTAPDLDSRLVEAVGQGADALVLDLSALDFISSAGLRVLFKAKKQLEESGGKLMLVNLQPQVRKVFEIIKALPTLSVFQSWEEMDEYLEHMQQQGGEG